MTTTTPSPIVPGTALDEPDEHHRRDRFDGRGPRGLARWCAEHRWRTLLAGLLVLAGAIVLLGGGLTTTSDGDQLVGDSREAARISAGVDFGTRPTENVVVTSRAGAIAPADAARIGRELTAAYSGVSGVATVGRPVPARDGRTMVLAVGLDAVSGSAKATGVAGKSPGDVVGPMLDTTNRFAAAHPGLQVGQV